MTTHIHFFVYTWSKWNERVKNIPYSDKFITYLTAFKIKAWRCLPVQTMCVLLEVNWAADIINDSCRHWHKTSKQRPFYVHDGRWNDYLCQLREEFKYESVTRLNLSRKEVLQVLHGGICHYERKQQLVQIRISFSFIIIEIITWPNLKDLWSTHLISKKS